MKLLERLFGSKHRNTAQSRRRESRYRPQLEQLDERVTPTATQFRWIGSISNNFWDQGTNWQYYTGASWNYCAANVWPGKGADDLVLFDGNATSNCDVHANVPQICQLIVNGGFDGYYIDLTGNGGINVNGDGTNSIGSWNGGELWNSGSSTSKGHLYLRNTTGADEFDVSGHVLWGYSGAAYSSPIEVDIGNNVTMKATNTSSEIWQSGATIDVGRAPAGVVDSAILDFNSKVVTVEMYNARDVVVENGVTANDQMLTQGQTIEVASGQTSGTFWDHGTLDVVSTTTTTIGLPLTVDSTGIVHLHASSGLNLNGSQTNSSIVNAMYVGSSAALVYMDSGSTIHTKDANSYPVYMHSGTFDQTSSLATITHGFTMDGGTLNLAYTTGLYNNNFSVGGDFKQSGGTLHIYCYNPGGGGTKTCDHITVGGTATINGTAALTIEQVGTGVNDVFTVISGTTSGVGWNSVTATAGTWVELTDNQHPPTFNGQVKRTA